MSAELVMDYLGALLLLGGALFSLAAALGLVRFPDALSRMHAATKPAVFGLLLVEAMPFLVEAGVLLDLFVGIFVLSIIIHHINREFASQDTRRLSLLKE